MSSSAEQAGGRCLNGAAFVTAFRAAVSQNPQFEFPKTRAYSSAPSLLILKRTVTAVASRGGNHCLFTLREVSARYVCNWIRCVSVIHFFWTIAVDCFSKAEAFPAAEIRDTIAKMVAHKVLIRPHLFKVLN